MTVGVPNFHVTSLNTRERLVSTTRPLQVLRIGCVQLILFNCCHGCTKSLTCLVCFLQNAVTSIAKRKAKLNDDCCVGESQDIEERDSFQEAHEKKRRLATGSATKPILRVKRIA